jgi:hypothetical protein
MSSSATPPPSCSREFTLPATTAGRLATRLTAATTRIARTERGSYPVPVRYIEQISRRVNGWAETPD